MQAFVAGLPMPSQHHLCIVFFMECLQRRGKQALSWMIRVQSDFRAASLGLLKFVRYVNPASSMYIWRTVYD